MLTRASSLYEEHKNKIYRQTDKLFGLLFILQWISCIAIAFTVTPKTWIGDASDTHLHIWGAIILGSLISSFPIYLILSKPGESQARYSIAIAQMLMGSLLIHLTGGRIETHFHVFGSLAFLAFYRDWKVLTIASVVVVLDHFFRGLFWSQSVFGIFNTDQWRWLEHGVWVIFEDIFLLYSCRIGRQEMKEIAHKQAKLERMNEAIENTVQIRTRELHNILLQQEALIQNIPDAIWMKDADLRYTTVNKIFLKTSNIDSLENILGKQDTELWPGDIAEKTLESDKRILNEAITLRYEESYVDYDNNIIWFDICKSPIKNENEEVVGIVGICRNITERKIAELKLVEVNDSLKFAYKEIAEQLEFKTHMEKKLLQAQKMEAIGTLTGGIAHDFNNILWMILGNSEMLLDELQEQPDLLEIQQDIFNAASRAKNLVQQLLDFSRKNTGSNSEQLVDIAPLVKEVGKMVRTMLPSSIELKTQLADTSKLIFADPTKIHQILMNLCTNAYHALGEVGTLAISTGEIFVDDESLKTYPKLEKEGFYLVLEVSDTGCGISPEVIDRIFDPFFTTKEVGKGTGLGLATVHGLVTEMGGAIYVYSEPTLGTTFKIYLPAVDACQTQADTQKPAKQGGTLPAGQKHILVTDDEEAILQMLSKMLTAAGYKVSCFCDGLEALQALKNDASQFDLIITDQTMPKMTGIDFAREALQLDPQKPVILATGYSKVIAEDSFSAVPIYKFMNKPFHRQELLDVLNQAFSNR